MNKKNKNENLCCYCANEHVGSQQVGEPNAMLCAPVLQLSDMCGHPMTTIYNRCAAHRPANSCSSAADAFGHTLSIVQELNQQIFSKYSKAAANHLWSTCCIESIQSTRCSESIQSFEIQVAFSFLRVSALNCISIFKFNNLHCN